MTTYSMNRRGFLRVAGISAGAAAALAACGTPGSSGSGGAGGTTITMFHWAGAQGTVPVQVGDAYAKAKGVTVKYIEGTNADVFPKLVSSVQINRSNPLLNLGFFNAQSFAQGNSKDLWLPVPDSVSAVSGVLPKYQIPDRNGAYLVMDAMGLVYNKKAFPTPPTSWMDLFAAASKGKVTTWDAPAFSVNALPVIAKLNGGSETNLQPGIDVFAKAAKAKQFRGFISSVDQLRQQLNSGEVVIAPGFQGVAEPWIQAGDPIGFAVPKEGAMAFPEGFQIVKGSSDAQVTASAELMNELFTPASVAAYCNATGTLPLVRGATMDARYANRPSFQLSTVEQAIQVDWAALVTSITAATQAWNDQVKANI
ncbi:putative spermidine/putrescine transport system substrate-binding protein [Amycolatopsis sulphurea]|uniref:Putative spermidine/putrescine transport system substrate-binding protein n=1 Tax=Amycolatopsis sulphurea TaxID=76022 RepID=A0A2A9G2G8_9PSEU|nr:extracellular solute-binding protein [Amycolatopsis sulphurea]PFG57000.1 putative spermidine/putrescine transport system substrate-binding protein [Amycolatopsis sulphurea]